MEHLAMGWHIWGIVVSLGQFSASLAAIGVAVAMQSLLSIIPGLFTLFFWTSAFCAFNAGSGALWHVWAVVQHSDHLKELPEDNETH